LFALIGLAIALWSHSAECARETDWWRTAGAAVVEHQEGNNETVCSLFFYNNDNAAVVTWGKAQVRDISFYDQNWRFSDDQQIPVAVRIGETWLGHTTDRSRPYLVASADQERLSVPIQAPAEELLRNTPQITVQLGDRELSVGVARGKMPALLKAVERCRAVLK
jgi:hypothetical protein